MVMSLREVLAHGRAELCRADEILGLHRADDYGMCACLRALPCPVWEQWAPQARYWRHRISHYEQLVAAPTIVLPTLAR